MEQERAYWEGVDPTDRVRNFCSDTELYGLDLIRTTLAVEPAQRVLDLGCGPGRLAIPFAAAHPETMFVGLDISFSTLRLAQARAEDANIDVAHLLLVHGYGRTIPVPDSHFDAAYSMLLFQHLPPMGVAKYLAELGRVLRSGARWVFQYVEGDQHHPFNHEHDEEYVRAWCAAGALTVGRVDSDGEHPEWRWVTGVRA